MRRLVVLLTVLCLCFVLFGSGALAAQNVLPLNDIIADSENWEINKTDVLPVVMGKVELTEPNTIVGYTGSKFKNEILAFNLKIDFNDGDWTYISLRNNKASFPVWDMEKSYAVFFRNDGAIVLEKWFSTQQVLETHEGNPFKDGQEHAVEFGAVNVEGGVQLILKVDGNIIFDFLDTENVISDEGYFSAMTLPGNKMTISNAEVTSDNETVESPVPSSPETGDIFILSYGLLIAAGASGCIVTRKRKK